jgi:MFS family permease
VLLDLTPLRRNRDFRLVFIGQFVSAFGTLLTVVAVPIQIYELTKSSATVGLLGTAQLVPLAVTSLWGGAVADAIDRRRLLLWSEVLLLVSSLALVANAMTAQPSVWLLFAIAAFQSAVSGFHRPALESLTQRVVPREDLPAVSALTSLRGNVAAIAGPAFAGIAIAAFGLPITFAIDAATFAVSLVALAMIHAMPPAANAPAAGFASILDGLRYAASRPELIGTYVVDIVAMTFAMPMALFPALAHGWHRSTDSGYLFAAMSAGAVVVALFSRWTHRVRRHGAAVLIAAALWGASIVALGYAPSLPVAMLCLALAGAADGVSGLFRMTMWNETIPADRRGRMAGIEQLSYMSGPLLGNARAGFMAEWLGLSASIAWGGGLCIVGVLACIPLLPAFWRYRATPPPRAT